MRQAIGSTWVFQLVIIFTLIFAAYIALTINYSRSFKVKNEVLSIIEKSEGFTKNGVKLINNYLNQSGYKTVGKCTMQSNAIVYGVTTLDTTITGSTVERAKEGHDYYYCFSKYGNYHSYYKGRAYYKINLFFQFDLPFFGNLSTFTVDGQTSEIDATFDKDELTEWNK